MIHFPILRAGQPYSSLTTTTLPHFLTGEPVAEVSQANRGLIARDLSRAGENRRVLQRTRTPELLQRMKQAARLFMESDLPVGDDVQSPDEYVANLSATTGMPIRLCRSNMEKIRLVLENIGPILGGLTRGLDLDVLDRGFGVQDGRALSYLCQADALGAVLPSNSPGVHSLWIPSIALKVPVVLRPGRQEPWTPFRVLQALLAAGVPPEACSFYPSDYDGAAEILLRCGRSMLFGDRSTVQPWQGDPRVQIHGPGWSKVIIARDQIGEAEKHLDVIVSSIAENGGRSCINASGVWTAGRGRKIAEALAEKLAAIEAKPLDDPESSLAAFPSLEAARQLSRAIDAQLERGGAEDLTRKRRGSDRVVQLDGATFMLPTLIWCDTPRHPLAQAEYLFPFASVLEIDQARMLDEMGPTLVASAMTEDPDFVRRLLACQHIDRLNLGPVPTHRISWDQPHEGNIFELLYRQRAFQSAAPPEATSPEALPGVQ